jgi:serine/threonine protein kinase/tetratricopeptide (TPR) repeat protein
MPTCPRCGAELDPHDPAGLCPACLIHGAFATSTSMDTGFENQIPDAGTEASGDDDFGRYRILRPLGEGGMGTVYLAEQREPIRRYVALKVIKPGMDTSQVLARFANERQALAIMDHPNIARIFDAGATRKGRPYFVMEYIEGEPITRYCDAMRMTVGKRLELFVAVCRAVQHAHQKGVIHRDIKPSNVLVKEQDGMPLPKVIDFGIARATDQWTAESTQLTQFGQMVGTPEYASPEQADVMIGAVGQTSDVYSLGVLLYELLIGTVPFDGAAMRRAGFSEMLRIIREEEAPSLPGKLDTMGAAATGVAERRQTEPASLRQVVVGDLDRVTRKALEKLQERRYPSVTELAADIQRYLDRQPVLARKFPRSSTQALAKPAISARSGRAKTVRGRKVPVVLGDFANTTGDPAFEGTLRRMTAVELGQSPLFSVLPDSRMSEVLRQMVRASDTRITPEVASEICERTGSAAVVEGWITRLGHQYMLGLRARNCRTGDVLHEEQAPAASQEQVFGTLNDMAERFRARVGESLPPVEKHPAMSAEITTPSMEAWRSYNAAMKGMMHRAQATEAVSLLKRAIELDPGFATAHAALGRIWDSLGQCERGAQSIARAYDLRNKVSERENLYITFNYFRQVTRNLELARQTLESWAQKYPGELLPHGFLSGLTSPGLGRHEKAVAEGLKAIRLDPNFAIGYFNTAFAYLYLDRLPEAEALLRKASERKIEVVEFSLCRYFVAFLGNDKPAMETEATRRKAKLEGQGWFEHQEAMTLAYQGRLKEADRLSDGAVNLARQGGLPERAAMFEGARAVWNALFGIRSGATKSAVGALSLFNGRDAVYGPAFAFALLNDSTPEHNIVADLETRYPEDTSVQFSYLPALRALEALNRGEPAKAIEFTQAAVPYELAVPGTAYFTGASFFGALYPVYVRGLAYSRSRSYSEAASEFRKILDHPGITLNDPVGPMARLQLARALAASGNRAGAAGAYRDLLVLWKDADPDVPVVHDARAESAG